MAVTYMNELKKFEGQPWSAWTDFIGCIVPPETVENNVPSNINKNDTSGSMRLNKSDMAIYGQYPGAETFELAVCEFCGDKFKLAALADHIELRHQDGKKVPALDISSAALTSKAKLLQLDLQKKGKSRYNKHAKDRNEKAVTVTGNKVKTKMTAAVTEEKISNKQPPTNENDKSDNYIDSPLSKLEKNSKLEKTDQQQPLSTLLKQDPGKLKNLKLKLRKTKDMNDISSAKIVNSKIGKNGSVMNSNSSTLVKTKEKQKLENAIRKTVVKIEQDSAQTPSSPSTSPENLKTVEEIAMMQPIVQLSPIDYPEGCAKAPIMLQDAKRRLKTDKKILTMKDRTYNPDRHCGVVGKENTKPCTRSLTCKSHSMSLRRAVRGRSKAFDMLLADHRAEKEMFKQKLMENNFDSSVETSEVIISSSSPTTMVLSTNSRGESELQKLKTKTTRNSVAEYSRLSLPVSIKNPNIFTSLQNQNDKGKSNFNNSAIPNGTVPNTVRLLGASSILKKQVVNPLLSRQENISGTVSTLHTSSFQLQQPLLQHQIQKHIPVKHWCPGYRRTGGLLYSNSNIPKINGIVTSKTENSIIVESIPVQNIPLPTSTITVMQSKSTNNIFHQMSGPQPELLKRIPLSLGPGKKKTLATLIPKQATSLLMPTVTLPGQSLLSSQSQKKTAVLQVSSPQIQNGIIYCQNQVGSKRVISEDVLNISPKRIKRDTKVNIVGPIVSKNNSGNTVMRLSISNGVVEKEISNSFPYGYRSLQPGVSLLQNNGIRLPSARVHYVTSSGPLPVTLQQLPVVPQVQLKQVEVKSRIPPKFKLIAPNVTVTSAGMVFIHKDQRN